MTPPPESPEERPPELTRIVERNIRALLARLHQEEHARSWQDRLAAAAFRSCLCDTGHGGIGGGHLSPPVLLDHPKPHDSPG